MDVLTSRFEDHLNPEPYEGYLLETYVDNTKAEQTDGFSLADEADACGENPFAELAGFVMSMLVLPYSNAEVERTFSQHNIVKSKLRNKLKPGTTNANLVQGATT
ncbi:hypothetical protein HPB52_016271 [Rhipicephalus sanguineus]|uniref:HAT C-terminal dimerisation domain-containing protein n=1 Tax=Rhipicephalus sanguineus TaxID=34632 RepID=A0A9D4PMX4_RHISA|nr:hypothetical protein HPB52_016271 [Rhipicephalus sanguineus]